MNTLYNKFLENRGLTKEYLEQINDSHHKDLKDIDKMAEMLQDIYLSSEKIVVLPDFDMDGIASSVVGFSGLAELGFNVSLYKRDPKLGYEFSEKDIDIILDTYPDVKTIITCDVGISCYDAISYAKKLGLRVLVTDHHNENPKTKDKMLADIVINPNKVGDDYDNKSICGAYVLWQVLYYYSVKYRDSFLQDQIYRLRVFAGIGTISDGMNVLYENRKLIKDSISILNMLIKDENEGDFEFLHSFDEEDLAEDVDFKDSLLYDDLHSTLLSEIKSNSVSDIYKMSFDGLSSLLTVLKDNGKIQNEVDEMTVGFYIAPMFNSIRRLDFNMSIAINAFYGSSKNIRVLACNKLFDANETRKDMVKEAMEELLNREQKYAPYIYFSNASSGVLGLLATKLLNLTGLPNLVITKKRDKGYGYKGSGRSDSWYDFLTELRGMNYFAQGHENAFGVGFTDEKEIKSCYTFLKNDVEGKLSKMDSEELESYYDVFISDHDKDALGIDLDEIRGFKNLYEKLRPFGPGFVEPVIKLTAKRDSFKVFTMGSDHQHLKVVLDNGLGVLKWNDSDLFDDINNSSEIEVLGKIDISEYMGNISVNIIGDSIRCVD